MSFQWVMFVLFLNFTLGVLNLYSMPWKKQNKDFHKNKAYFMQRAKVNTTEMRSEAWYINGSGKDLRKFAAS